MTTVAILGGGQLARLLALAGHDLGVRCRIIDPIAGCPASSVAEEITADWQDEAALDRLVAGAQIATFEREHLPLAAVHRVAGMLPLHPGPQALATLQSRSTQRRFLTGLGLEQPRLALPKDADDYRQALQQLGLPVIVKAAHGGYDGRGQRLVRSADMAEQAWRELSPAGVVIEQVVPFDEEVAILAVRGHDGGFAAWPLIRTHHVSGILALAEVHPQGERWQERAESIARTVAEALDYVGVLCVELFRVGDRLLVNEVAPRVHNSGHWTIEGSECSQFENHLRAILGLPLGSTAVRGVSALVNLIGVMPEPRTALTIPGVHWHDYGKGPRAGRKLGHLTITARDRGELSERLARLRAGGIAFPEGRPHGQA